MKRENLRKKARITSSIKNICKDCLLKQEEQKNASKIIDALLYVDL